MECGLKLTLERGTNPTNRNTRACLSVHYRHQQQGYASYKLYGARIAGVFYSLIRYVTLISRRDNILIAVDVMQLYVNLLSATIVWQLCCSLTSFNNGPRNCILGRTHGKTWLLQGAALHDKWWFVVQFPAPVSRFAAHWIFHVRRTRRITLGICGPLAKWVWRLC